MEDGPRYGIKRFQELGEVRWDWALGGWRANISLLWVIRTSSHNIAHVLDSQRPENAFSKTEEQQRWRDRHLGPVSGVPASCLLVFSAGLEDGGVKSKQFLDRGILCCRLVFGCPIATSGRSVRCEARCLSLNQPRQFPEIIGVLVFAQGWQGSERVPKNTRPTW